MVEVTSRTVQGRLLLRPDRQIASLCRGVLARAARLYPVRIHAFVFLSNHYHLLLSAESAQRLAGFMNYLNSNLAREIGRHVGWRERFWGRRYQAILVSEEESAQVERLRYVLSHGCKEGFVRRPGDWPGATAVDALLSDSLIQGHWLDRSGLYEAMRRKRPLAIEDFVSTETLELEPLPCWRHLSRTERRSRILDLVGDIEEETARRLEVETKKPLGARRIERQNPHQATARPRRGPAPLIHAVSGAVRAHFREAYRGFVRSYRRAAEVLRKEGPSLGLLELFPLGSFPPPMQSVPIRGFTPG